MNSYLIFLLPPSGEDEGRQAELEGAVAALPFFVVNLLQFGHRRFHDDFALTTT